jgi:hypothetical protein
MINGKFNNLRTFACAFRLLAAGGVLSCLAAACGSGDTDNQATLSARSVAAMITEMAASTPSPSPTANTLPEDAPTATTGPVLTPVTPTAIATVELASPTPKVVRATFSGPTPTFDGTSLLTRTLASRCSAAFFVGDVAPIFENTEVKADSTFVKTWVVRNVGTCTWYPGYLLYWHSGARMEGPDYINFPEIVPPNRNMFLTLTLVAPREPGKYYSRWYMRDPEMNQFGIGANFDEPLMIRIIAV